MKKIVFGLCLYAAAMATQALELASESSMLNVVSVKNNRVAELFSFDAVTGQLNTTTGNALINIDLASIDSGIDIRDKRIKNTFLMSITSRRPRSTPQLIRMPLLLLRYLRRKR